MSENALISINEAAKILGFDKPQPVHAFIKRNGIQKIKEGNKTLVRRADIIEAMQKPVEPSKKRKPRKKANKIRVEVVEEDALAFAPFEANPMLTLWNKGKFRGWAVAAIEEVSKTTVTYITDYGKRVLATRSKAVDDLRDGTMFCAEPNEVVRFLIVQLLRLPQTNDVKQIILNLEEVASQLDLLKENYKPEKIETEQVNELEDIIYEQDV